MESFLNLVDIQSFFFLESLPIQCLVIALLSLHGEFLGGELGANSLSRCCVVLEVMPRICIGPSFSASL